MSEKQTGHDGSDSPLRRWRQWLLILSCTVLVAVTTAFAPANVNGGSRHERDLRDYGRDATAGRAIALARQQPAGPLADELWRPVPLRPDERLVEYVGPHSARIDRGHAGPGALLHSTFPLRVRDDAGRLSPVDLQLQAQGTALRPRNPIVGTTVGRDVSDGVTLDDVGVRVTPAGLEATPVSVVDGRAFYANAARDTDWVFEPLPQGVQTFAILRSDASPESYPVRFETPPGANLRKARGPLGGYEVARNDDVLVRVGPPRAWDADNRPVPVHSGLDGSVLRIRAEHRGRDVRYPITIDPPVVENFQHWKTSTPPPDFNGWTFARSDPNKFTMFNGSAFVGNGLYVYTRQLNAYTTADFGEWTFNARGYGDAYIYRAEFSNLYHDGSTSNTTLYTGIRNRTTGAWEPNSPISATPGFFDFHTNSHCVLIACTPSGSRGNTAVFGTRPASNGNRSNFTEYLGGAIFYEYDDVIPQLTTPNFPSGWVESATGVIARFTDTGLGMRTVALAVEPPRAWSETSKGATATCDGTRNSACPKDLDATFGSGDLPEGSNTLRFTGTDIIGTQGTDTRAMKIDKSAPVVTLTGGLSGGGFVGDGTLHVDATDGSTASPAAQRSGVKSIEILVDGTSQGVNTQTCPAGSCPMARDFVLTAEGRHDIRVVVNDQLNHPTVKLLNVVLDKTPPAVQLSGTLREYENDALWEDSYGLTVNATDGSIASKPQERSGVKSIEILVKAPSDADYVRKDYVQQSCAAGSCPLSRSFTLRPADYAENARLSVKVVVSDQLAHATSSSWDVWVDRRGDIYGAGKSAVLADDDTPFLEDREWARAGSHDGRVEHDDLIRTRTTVNAPAGSYDEVRTRSTLVDDADQPTPEQTYIVERGDGTDDPDLEIPADLLAPAEDYRGQAPTASGPFRDSLASGQVPPPAHGATYERYDRQTTAPVDDDGTEQPATAQTWLDQRTKLPIRERVRRQDGSLFYDFTFSYDHYRLERSEVPSDFFAVGRPANVGMEKDMSENGNRRIGTMQDEETSAQFTPYYMGQSFAASSGPWVMVGSDVHHQRMSAATAAGAIEPDADPEDLPSPGHGAPETTVNAYYAQVPGAIGFVPGQPLRQAPLWVTSMARDSSTAKAWRSTYIEEGEAIQADPTDADNLRAGVVPVFIGLQPTTAYVIALDDDTTSALLDAGGTTVILEGPYTKSELPAILQKLEVF